MLRTSGCAALLAAALLLGSPSEASEEGHSHPPSKSDATSHEQHEAHEGATAGSGDDVASASTDHAYTTDSGHDTRGHGSDSPHDHARMMRAMTGPLGLGLQQRASGTGWAPHSTPMYGHMWLAGEWSVMLHYQLFSGLNVQGSDRGETHFTNVNWVMGMAQRRIGRGQLTTRAMLSLEPLMLGARGYPLLLQTGETANGAPLVDRQHPHDLFMEVAALWDQALTNDFAVQLYVAPAGEPALGPTAFPHRISAMSDPLAPLSHHWQDSTHILFGVVTAGVYTRHFKLEGSIFNGREPDENRYGFDLRRLDSYSVRLSANLTSNWTAQVSHGWLKEPEFALEPGVDIRRVTASTTYNRRLANGGNWATTLAWGQNQKDHGGRSDSYLAETNVLFSKNNVFARAEYVVKNGHEFAFEGPLEEATFHTGALAAGYVRDFGPFAGLIPGVGVRGAINVLPASLEPTYGTRLPLGGMVFLRLRPEEMMTNATMSSP